MNGTITIDQFENQYLEKFKNETIEIGGKEFKILDALFAAVDRYCGNEALRDEYDLDEAQLLGEAKSALSQLNLDIQ